MSFQAKVGASGAVSLKVFRGLPQRQLRVTEMVRYGMPWFGVDAKVNRWRLRNLPNFWRGFWRIALARLFRLPHMYGQIYLRVFRGDGSIEDLGLASLRVVTDAGVAYLVDAFQGINSAEPELMKYHGFGTGLTPEGVGQTALVAELTAQYATDNVRPTGAPSEPSSNVYRTLATLVADGGVAVGISEHGLFSSPTSGSATLWDRSLFGAVTLNGSTDALQATYDATFVAGG